MVKKLFLVLYYLVFAIFYLGFVLHRSSNPKIFQYSLPYLLFIFVLLSGILIPHALNILIKRHGRRKILFAILPVVVLVLIVYSFFSILFKAKQEYRFDPFLQKAPPPINPASFEKPEGAFRIVALGGSTTRNTKLPEEKRYPTVLQNLLRKRYGPARIEVFNAGMEWYTTKHSLINYVTNLREWKPDLAIVMHGINDLYRSFSPSQFALGPHNRLWSHFYGPSIHGAKPMTLEKLLLSKFLSIWCSQIRLKERDFPLSRYVSIKEFEENFLRLIHYLKRDNLFVILLTQPSIYKDVMSKEELSILLFGKSVCTSRLNLLQEEYPSPRSLRAAMKAFNNVTRRIAQSEGVPLVDLDLKIAKDLAHFRDDVHYTELGARELAQAVGKKIIQGGFIEE